jgi:hypothetical protein
MPDESAAQVAEPAKQEETTEAKPSNSRTPGERATCSSYREAKALAGNLRRSGNPDAYVVYVTALKSWCVQQ